MAVRKRISSRGGRMLKFKFKFKLKFRQVTNNAIVAGLQDVAGVANALSAGKLEQSLNDASGGSLGSDIFGTYGTTSVSRMNEANAQMMRDQGNNTGAFITDFANSTSNVAFNLIPLVTGLGASTAATSLAGRTGKLVSSVDNILGSPGSLVGMGKSALGSIDNVVSGGRATKFLSSLGSSFGQGLSSVGRGMGKGLAALGTKIGKTTSPFLDELGLGSSGLKVLKQDLSDTLTLATNPIETLRYVGRSADKELFGGSLARSMGMSDTIMDPFEAIARKKATKRQRVLAKEKAKKDEAIKAIRQREKEAGYRFTTEQRRQIAADEFDVKFELTPDQKAAEQANKAKQRVQQQVQREATKPLPGESRMDWLNRMSNPASSKADDIPRPWMEPGFKPESYYPNQRTLGDFGRVRTQEELLESGSLGPKPPSIETNPLKLPPEIKLKYTLEKLGLDNSILSQLTDQQLIKYLGKLKNKWSPKSTNDDLMKILRDTVNKENAKISPVKTSTVNAPTTNTPTVSPTTKPPLPNSRTEHPGGTGLALVGQSNRPAGPVHAQVS